MRALLLLPLVFSLSGCNWFNHVTGLSKDSDKAIGAACRQTGRSLEECYLRNPDADRAQVFSGWREMHEYMVKQQLPTMSPPPDPKPAPASAAASAPPPPAQKTSDNSAAPDEMSVVRDAVNSTPDSGKPDPEVQAVLDTINNRPHSNAAAQPSPSEQEKLQQVLAGAGSQSPPPGPAEHGAKKKKG